MKRNCDNCNNGSYNMNCNTGEETLFCRESEYEIEVEPKHVCSSHNFIDGYEYSINKTFLKRLTDEQLKVLILLVINEYETEQNYKTYSNYVQTLAHIKLMYSEEKEWDNRDKVYIGTKIGYRTGYFRPWFMVNDTEIEMHDGNLKKEYNKVLQKYFSQIFGKEYIEFLYNLKLDELNRDKVNLIKVSEGPSLKKILNKIEGV